MMSLNVAYPWQSDCLPISHMALPDISALQLKKLLETQVPTPSVSPFFSSKAWKKEVSAYGWRFGKKSQGNADQKKGQCALGQFFKVVSLLSLNCFETQRSKTLSVGRNRTQTLILPKTEINPEYSRSQALDTWTSGSHSWPVLLLSHYDATLKQREWKPSVC